MERVNVEFLFGNLLDLTWQHVVMWCIGGLLIYLAIAKDMVGKIALPCTACHYCVSHCPQGLDIPGLLSLYNEHAFTEGGFIAPMALMAVPEDKRPQACLGCRSCEAVCPQGIKISEAMADFAAKLG